MVSLINFKSVGEELGDGSSLFAVRVSAALQSGAPESSSVEASAMELATKSPSNPTRTAASGAPPHQAGSETFLNNNNSNSEPGAGKQAPVVFMPLTNLQQQQSPPTNSAAPGEPGSKFVVTWRNLNFSIEPKWHERALSAAITGSGVQQHKAPAKASGAEEQQQQQQQQSQSQETVGSQQQQQASARKQTAKTVLDRLDGSFKSGELTAILGPSGAGKTTLLDCLTGRRKNGLTGSIRILGSASSPAAEATAAPMAGNKCAGQQQQQLYFKGPAAEQQPNGDNLKVSIIPQNDHLMGHLTVYETLMYASKMKNCFHRNFDHRLNVKRVAQQLGLLTCLGNRINKLSGGQYKRVSIAQELLSSPDILILDEPTSGLDAMTCYQTVQVLRRLVDERRATGHSQIAVILTIHQPNSDVFQQFNHVYVVAQGGRCIYEGAPAAIESMINRVGIRMPSSYYNPATMIVEIAAAKFGQEAIEKLSAIQKKQYLQCPASGDCEHPGDSAVDCPSGSSFASSSDFSSSLSSSLSTNEDDEAGGASGQVNAGFQMDEARRPDCIINVVAHRDEDQQQQQQQKTKAAQPEAEPNDPSRLRKKRRRTRRRSDDQQPSGSLTSGELAAAQQLAGAGQPRRGSAPVYLMANGGGGGGGGGEEPCKRAPPNQAPAEAPQKRLKLNSLKAGQKFPFWRHTYLHFHRSWLSIVRDPMLCSMQLALHILVPIMVSLVYGTKVGKPNACPRAGPVNIMAYALEPADKALELQEEFRTTIENIGYIFFKLYGIIFAAMTVTVLTFPLDMHVLVKEFRNGWYGLSSYFLGRTLADIPFALTLPLLAMSLSYYATGQPYSYFQWRFLSITGVLILSSLIAQSQGLLFGAILMDRMKAAVFVAPAATTPIILFAGFLVRTQTIPAYLRPLSNLSYLRYAIEACLISRYGFNQCQCDPSIFNETVPELPPMARSMLDYWLSSFKAANESSGSGELDQLPGSALTTTTTTTTEAPDSQSPDLFSKLIDSLAKANSFGRNITSCEQVVPYPMMDYDLKDSQLLHCFAILLCMLLVTRLLTFFIVCTKVRRKV